MRTDFRVARACATEAIRHFHLHEYAPFGWILAAQLVFLGSIAILGTPIAMLTAGSLARLIVGDEAIHYPGFLLKLPIVAQRIESFLYAVPGSLLIPLGLIRIFEVWEEEPSSGAAVRARLRAAFLPTLAASIANFVLLELWQWWLNQSGVPIMKLILAGYPGAMVTWLLAVLVSFAISAFFIYVPILSVQPGATFRRSLIEGLGKGILLFRHTYFFIVAFSSPALAFLFLTQLRTAFILQRTRPELVVVLLAMYSLLLSVASYLTYAWAARLYAAERGKGPRR